MARRKHEEEHENHERWLISYADFITLLFAFFVVMYSISSINDGKYRVLSNALVSAFQDPSRSIEPIQLGTPLKDPIIQHNTITETISRVGVDYAVVPNPPNADRTNPTIQRVADDVKRDLKSLVDQDLVNVTTDQRWVEIEIKSNVLFSSGQSRLESAARPVLAKIAVILKGVPNQIQVEGFTDNVPIRTDQFRSNWDLSAARSVSVVHLFEEAGIKPERLSAIGYGEYRPVDSNATEAGRNQNRRVAIVVLADDAARRDASLDPAARAAGAQSEGASAAANAAPGLVVGAPIRLGGPRAGDAP